jgi:hypothetical protein
VHAKAAVADVMVRDVLAAIEPAAESLLQRPAY